MSSRDLTNGPVWRALAAVSAPMTFGILAVLSVGVVDAYFLGQLGGAPLAAVGFIYPVTTALTSLGIGLAAGANATISQSVGRRDDAGVTARYALHAVGLGVVLSSVVMVLLWLGFPVIFPLMGASDTVMAEISAYVPFWALSFPLLVTTMAVNAIFRAYGNGALSAGIMVVSAVINIALNPLLIFGGGVVPALGTEGAALATFIGRAIAAAAAIGYALRLGYLDRCAGVLTDLRRSLRKVLDVAAPAAFSNAINPAGMALITAAVATLGDAAVAGFGAATRVQSVGMVVMFALSAGIGPVVGQNWGADRFDRARSALAQAWGFCAIYGLILALGLFVFAEAIATAISVDPAAAAYTRQYLQVVGWSLLGYGVLVTANAAMNARSKAVYSMALSLGRIFLVYLPAAWAGVWLFGYTGILAATVLANGVTVLAAVLLARHVGLFRLGGGSRIDPARARTAAGS